MKRLEKINKIMACEIKPKYYHGLFEDKNCQKELNNIIKGQINVLKDTSNYFVI